MKKLLITIFTLTVAFLPCFASDILLTDYSESSNWLARPVQNPYPADVFYIYPTVCTTKDNTNLCKVNDSQMREAAKSVINFRQKLLILLQIFMLLFIPSIISGHLLIQIMKKYKKIPQIMFRACLIFIVHLIIILKI